MRAITHVCEPIPRAHGVPPKNAMHDSSVEHVHISEPQWIASQLGGNVKAQGLKGMGRDPLRTPMTDEHLLIGGVPFCGLAR